MILLEYAKGQSAYINKITNMSSVLTDLNPPCLTLKTPITTAADDIHKYIFIVF